MALLCPSSRVHRAVHAVDKIGSPPSPSSLVARGRSVWLHAARQASLTQTTLFRDVCTEEEVVQAVKAHVAAPSGSGTELVIMYTATWCGPCAIVHKELEKLAALRNTNKHPLPLEVLVVDVEREGLKGHCTAHGINALPTLCFIGKDTRTPVVCTVGNTNYKVIQDVLDNRMHICGADLKTRLKIN